MLKFDVYRRYSNGLLVWIGAVESLQAAYELVKVQAKHTSDEFAVRTFFTYNLTHVRADETHESA